MAFVLRRVFWRNNNWSNNLCGLLFHFFQLDKQNKTQKRLSVLPYLDVSIEDPKIDYSKDEYLLLHDSKDIFRAMHLSDKVTSYCGRYVYDFLESYVHDIVYKSVIYPNILPGFVRNKSVSIQLKRVTIKNIGLNSAISVNVYLNRISQWNFNLEKDAFYSFYYVLDETLVGKQIDIQIAFRDLLGNEYQQSCFVVCTPNESLTGEVYQKSVTQSPLLTKEQLF